MNLERPTKTPKFVEYAINYALKPPEGDWPDEVDSFDPNPIKIPPYQRKIVWDEETISGFLESKAVLFGTVILAQSPSEHYLILLDGLQRFATSTAILNYLYSEILPHDTAGVKELLKILAAETESKQAIFRHNDSELRNNTRGGIRESYKQLYDTVKSIIDKLIEDPPAMADRLIQTFLKKQIAIDTYHGFMNSKEYTQTFININSTGINLTEVDLLRSEIIQQAETRGWDPADVDEIENRFTEVFQSSKIKAAKVLGKHLYDALMRDQTTVFERWGELDKDDVLRLLDFVDGAHEAASKDGKDGSQRWPYLYESFQCGDIAFSIIVWFYYNKYRECGERPDFLGGRVETGDDLRALLRSFYRRIANNSMNRAGKTASELIGRKNPAMLQSMRAVADDIKPTDETLDDKMGKSWIENNLKRSGTGKTKRMFNACLLPELGAGGDFRPVRYGQRGWALEYLVPRSAAAENAANEHVDHITNKMPVPSDLKQGLRNKTCRERVRPDGELGAVKTEHPYLSWLLGEHYEKHKDARAGADYALDSPTLLSEASPIGRERLEKIVGLLHDRI